MLNLTIIAFITKHTVKRYLELLKEIKAVILFTY